MAFVHPFDDPDVVAGQGTLGLELLDDVPDLAKVVVPARRRRAGLGHRDRVKSARPEIEVVGVQVDACAPYRVLAGRRAGRTVATRLTIADGIAVKRPGGLTLGCCASGSTTSSSSPRRRPPRRWSC
jgi:threonine dehydratase